MSEEGGMVFRCKMRFTVKRERVPIRRRFRFVWMHRRRMGIRTAWALLTGRATCFHEVWSDGTWRGTIWMH